MRLSTLCMTTLLAVGAVGMAHATATITNGDFSQISTPKSGCSQATGTPTEIGSSYHCGQFVTGWKASGYAIWYPSATAASGTQADTQYGNTGNQFLPAAVSAPPTGSTFVGLDGQSGIAGSIEQTVTGLTSGSSYTVSFYWASTQEMSRTGATTEYLTVSLGNESFKTGENNTPSQGFVDWALASFTFTADSSTGTGWNVLNFLSTGNPGSPPFALLSDVSITRNVPEPPVLAMFGGGLLGLGLLIMVARRREMHRRDADGNNAIV